jgi:hypothetical protein
VNHRSRRGRLRRAPQSVAALTRAQAVDRIAAHLDTKDAYLLAIPPHRLREAATRLAAIPATVYYIDTGGDDLLAVTGPAGRAAVDLATRDAPPAMVTLAAVPARHAGRLPSLGIHPPCGAPHAFSVLSDDDEPLLWPKFLLDALELHDPGTAARIYMTRVDER